MLFLFLAFEVVIGVWGTADLLSRIFVDVHSRQVMIACTRSSFMNLKQSLISKCFIYSYSYHPN